MGKYLRRYTHLPALLYLLRQKKITLLSPTTWDDSNDSHYLLQYKEKQNLKSVLAFCFSQSKETYHHWRVFSGKAARVCIRFDKDSFKKALLARSGVEVQPVHYLRLRKAKTELLSIAQLPLLKRSVFSAEDEVRALFVSKRKVHQTLDINIQLSSINRITLSPWLPKALSPSINATIKAIDDCKKMDIRTSTIISNQKCKLLAESAT